MKNPLFRTSLAAITATAVYLGAFGNAASAQTSAANPPAAVQAPAMPAGVNEAMKLFKGGIAADIIVSYINNSTLSFYLSADNLIALRQEGVPAPVLTAMMQRNGELQRQAGTVAAAPAPVQSQAPPPQYAGAPVQAPAPAPAPQYYSYAPPQPAPAYTYAAPPVYPAYEPYPYYDPYFYPWYPVGGPVVFDFGFGHYGGGFGGRLGGGGRIGGRR